MSLGIIVLEFPDKKNSVCNLIKMWATDIICLQKDQIEGDGCLDAESNMGFRGSPTCDI